MPAIFECSGLMVELKTSDGRAASLRLTGDTALCY